MVKPAKSLVNYGQQTVGLSSGRGHIDQARFKVIAGGKFKNRVFEKVCLRWRTWRQACTDEIRRIASEQPPEHWQRLAKRATAIDHCIQGVKGLECRCGHPLEGSGEFRGGHSGGPCRSRICPRCGRKRATVYGRWLRKAVNIVDQEHRGAVHADIGLNPLRSEHSWKLITMTAPFDPTDPDSLAVDKLRERAKGLGRAWRSAWKLYRDEHSAAFKAVEMSDGGHVHIHVLAFCTWIDNDDHGPFMAAARAGWDGLGEIRDIRAAGDLEGALLEVAKYVTKMQGVTDGAFFTGHGTDGAPPPMVIHPHLAARWEVATYGLRMSEMFGAFRKIEKPKADEELDGDQAPGDPTREPCPCCGAVGDWWEWEGSVETWSARCQLARVRPFGRAWRAPPPSPAPDEKKPPPAPEPAKQFELEV